MAQQTGQVSGAPAGSGTSPYPEQGTRQEKEPLTSRIADAGGMGGALETEQQYLSKAAEEKGERVRTYAPGHFDAGVQRVVSRLQQLLSACTMGDQVKALEACSRDMVWDAPIMILRGKDNVRTVMYLFKPLAHLDFDPELVQVVRLPDLKSHLVDISGTLKVRPHRTLLLWPTLLLPKRLPFKMTVKLGVTGDLENGTIELLYDRPHNIPELPTPLRMLNGFVWGNVAHLTEPFWGPVAGFLGDGWYKRHYQPPTERVRETVDEYGRRITETGRAAAEKVQEPFAKAADVVRSPVSAGEGVGTPEGGEAARRVYGERQAGGGESRGGGQAHMGSANAPENPLGTATGALVGTTPVGKGGWDNM